MMGSVNAAGMMTAVVAGCKPAKWQNGVRVTFSATREMDQKKFTLTPFCKECRDGRVAVLIRINRAPLARR
jgi:hypothetical protein